MENPIINKQRNGEQTRDVVLEKQRINSVFIVVTASSISTAMQCMISLMLD
jgi:hypothetical protein